MNKHAYLIMAHDNWSILQKLLQLLDDPRHDVFLHIDAKSRPSFDLNQRMMRHSHLTTIEANHVYWADYSQVDTELRLLKEASQGEYSYYHLLSGVDMPLKTNDERFRFFEERERTSLGLFPMSPIILFGV